MTKKERGKLRYDRQQARVTAERIRARRTCPSDIAPWRITNGISPNHSTRVGSHYVAPQEKLSPFATLLRALESSQK